MGELLGSIRAMSPGVGRTYAPAPRKSRPKEPTELEQAIAALGNDLETLWYVIADAQDDPAWRATYAVIRSLVEPESDKQLRGWLRELERRGWAYERGDEWRVNRNLRAVRP